MGCYFDIDKAPAGTGVFTRYQYSESITNDSTVVATTVKAALNALARPVSNVYTSGPQALTTQETVVCNSAGGFTVNLPTAGTAYLNKTYIVKNIGAGSITLQGNVNIDNNASVSIAQWGVSRVKLIDKGSSVYLWISI
jgi:hypothetical protein